MEVHDASIHLWSEIETPATSGSVDAECWRGVKRNYLAAVELTGVELHVEQGQPIQIENLFGLDL